MKVVIEGLVLQKEENCILVARNVSTEVYEGLTFPLEYDVALTLNSCFYRGLDFDGFKPGDWVMIETNGIEMKSFPPQATALKIEHKKIVLED